MIKKHLFTECQYQKNHMNNTKYKKVAAIVISSLSAVLMHSLITFFIPAVDSHLSVVFVAIISASMMGEFWPEDF